MRLVFPTLEYKDRAIEYIEEFHKHGSEPNGCGGLERCLREGTYEQWLDRVIGGVDIANLQPPRVPELTYFYLREEDGRIVGMINLRLGLNDFLRTEGGHIGYSVRPSERGRHYATEMLKAALGVYDALGIKEVLITCDKLNAASAGVIKNCGGTLDAEFYSATYDETLQRYIVRRP